MDTVSQLQVADQAPGLLHSGFAQPPAEGQMIGAEYAAGDA